MRSLRFLMLWSARVALALGLMLTGSVADAKPKSKSVSKSKSKSKSKPKRRAVPKLVRTKVRKKKASAPTKKKTKRSAPRPTTVRRKKSNPAPVKKKTQRVRPKRTVRVAPTPSRQRRPATRQAPRTTAPADRPQRRRVRQRTANEQDRQLWRDTQDRVQRVIRNRDATRDGGASGNQRGGRAQSADGSGGGAAALEVYENAAPEQYDEPADYGGGWSQPPVITGGPGLPAADSPALPAESAALGTVEAPLTNDSISLAPAPPPLVAIGAPPSARSHLPRPTIHEDVEPPAPGWLEGVRMDASMSSWFYQPLDQKPDTANWSNVSTTEVYRIDPALLWKVGLRLDTRWLRVGASYESDIGFGVAGRASLLDMLFAFTALEALTIDVRRLDFDHGTVELRGRTDNRLIERAEFSTELTRVSVNYTLHQGVFVFGRVQNQALPRNVYLKDEGGTDPQYFQVSDQLLHIDTTQYMLGAGWRSADPLASGDPEHATGFWGGAYVGAGLGPYTIRTLAEREYLDEGLLGSLVVSAHLGWRTWLSDSVSVGIKDEISINPLVPLGLSDRLEKRQSGDTSNFSLDFGVADLLNEAQIYVALAL